MYKKLQKIQLFATVNLFLQRKGFYKGGFELISCVSARYFMKENKKLYQE